MTREIMDAAQLIWDYHHINHVVEKSDLIFVLCSHDLRVADYAATLFLKGLAPWILFSGGMAHHGDLLETGWDKSEAEMFADRAEAAGVPRDRMILECRARNTGENILLSEIILKDLKIHHHKILAVQKPYMERRAYATIKIHWPEKEVILTSPSINFENYPNDSVSIEELINIMTGDLERIIKYPARGFQIEQKMTQDVLTAYQYLLDAGYTRHLIQ